MLWIDKILQTIWGTYHTMVYYANEKGSKILPNWVALYILHQISGILTIKSLHWTSNPTKGNVIVGIHYFFFSFISLIGILPIGLICFQYLKLQYWPSNFTLDCRETSKEWATYRNDHLPTDRGFRNFKRCNFNQMLQLEFEIGNGRKVVVVVVVVFVVVVVAVVQVMA